MDILPILFNLRLYRHCHSRSLKRGQTLVEYALILATISIVAVVVLRSLGQHTASIYGSNNSTLDAALNYTGS
jgi:Flp pilus assembly pilin Flp